MQSHSRLKEEHMPGISVCDGWRDCGKTQLKITKKGNFPSKIGTRRAERWMVMTNHLYQVLLSSLMTALVCVFPLIVWISVHQGVNVHLLKHEIICNQHQSEFLFFLSVAYRPLIIHSCLLAPSSNFGNSISSMHMHTSVHVHTHTCIV